MLFFKVIYDVRKSLLIRQPNIIEHYCAKLSVKAKKAQAVSKSSKKKFERYKINYRDAKMRS